MRSLTDSAAIASVGSGSDMGSAFLGEMVGTCLVVLVVLGTATVESTRDNMYFALAIGFAILGAGAAVGRGDGAAEFGPESVPRSSPSRVPLDVPASTSTSSSSHSSSSSTIHHSPPLSSSGLQQYIEQSP